MGHMPCPTLLFFTTTIVISSTADLSGNQKIRRNPSSPTQYQMEDLQPLYHMIEHSCGANEAFFSLEATSAFLLAGSGV